MGFHRITKVDTLRRIASCSICGDNVRVTPVQPRYWRCINVERASRGRIPQKNRHSLSAVNREWMRAYCHACAEDVDLVFRGLEVKCKIGQQDQDRRQNFRRQYEIELPEVLPEKTVCEICGTSEDLRLDHNHQNNELRGWLCDSCNRLLSCAKDDTSILRKAIAYLTRSEISSGIEGKVST